MVGSVIQGLIVLNVEGYVWHNWHGALLTIAVIIFSTIFNTVLAARLPLLENKALVLHLIGLFAMIVPLWILAPRSDVRVALLQLTSIGGWSSSGLSSIIGLTSPS